MVTRVTAEKILHLMGYPRIFSAHSSVQVSRWRGGLTQILFNSLADREDSRYLIGHAALLFLYSLPQQGERNV